MQTLDRYAVMGNPISHSKSPQIHRQFAAQTGEPIGYEALLVAKDGFAAAVDSFQAGGGKGLNITVPFKQEAWALVADRSSRAELAGAVNTIIFDASGHRRADNTDGVGLVRDLTRNHAIDLKAKRLLLLGAGGAVRGVLAPLLACQPASLVVANRTVARAEELVRLFAAQGDLGACGFDELAAAAPFDLVINGTAASLEGKVPPLPAGLLADGASCYDMMYSRDATAFQRWAGEHGAAQALDGLGMLVEQAAEAFYLWRGVRPETAPVMASLRAELLQPG